MSLGVYLTEQTTLNKIRVACLGDSITAATEFSDYPTILQSMLGSNYTVGNFGVVAATVLSDTDKPYISQTAFQDARQFQPNIVIVMLGTNDAHDTNYPSIDKFKADYEKIIDETLAFTSNPRIFLVKPPPIFANEFGHDNTNLVEGVIPRIEQIAHERGLPTIDVYNALVNHPEYFADGLHPNQDGARILASEIYKAIIAYV